MNQGTAFTRLNDLQSGSDGVYHPADYKDFDYSDGEKSERELHTILSNATDLSSASAELEAGIVDWPTEYHLSSARANLLRGLNLDGVTRVLELGCGCGSITRYLGEQAGLQVDAVEGSAIRAALAAQRCRDLTNVTISSGNFNDMRFPENHYDLVLFVGVTEYAGRFSQGKSDQQALQELLALAKSTLNDDGVVLIAIENRLGLKYLMGACEDHYGKPYVGIEDYPESSGIRTYSKAEWEQQIQQAGFNAIQFAYPFPDYKVPTLMVGEQIVGEKTIGEKARLSAALSNIQSRDYVQDFHIDKEARLWQGVVEAGLLAPLSNSFLIAIGNDQARIANMLEFDLIEYAHKAPVITAKPNPNQLKTRLVDKQMQVEQLQQKLNLITASKGWRILTKIRSLFGRPTV